MDGKQIRAALAKRKANETADRSAPLREVFAVTAEARWKGTRGERIALAFAEDVVSWLEGERVKTLDDITSFHVSDLKLRYEQAGNSPGTVSRKLSIITTMYRVALEHKPALALGRPPRIRVKLSPVLKWWLTPDARAKLIPWLKSQGEDLMADYVEFICHTGLRVEEALRLRDTSFTGLDTDKPLLGVPGTKTGGSQRTVPISANAAAIARRRIAASKDGRLFSVTYTVLRDRWLDCRDFLGETRPTATLKALRRSFAKIASDKCMPIERLQKYLRHSDIKTTMGYLAVVGSDDMENSRQWL